MKTQLIFILLQVADVATTMVALQMGGAEKNALIVQMMGLGALQGLLLSKLIVLGIGTGAVLMGKHLIFRWANVVFAGVVAWNLTVIVRLALQARVG
jgi:hypothetical protein